MKPRQCGCPAEIGHADNVGPPDAGAGTVPLPPRDLGDLGEVGWIADWRNRRGHGRQVGGWRDRSGPGKGAIKFADKRIGGLCQGTTGNRENRSRSQTLPQQDSTL